MVPGEVLSIILPFAIRIVRGFPNNPYTASPGTLAVSAGILDPHHDCTPQRDTRALFNQDNRAPITDVQLSAVIPDANAESEPECVAQPINGIADVRVGQFRNHNAARHGSIGKHAPNFTKNAAPGDGPFTSAMLDLKRLERESSRAVGCTQIQEIRRQSETVQPLLTR
jgi:hypothetical protein